MSLLGIGVVSAVRDGFMQGSAGPGSETRSLLPLLCRDLFQFIAPKMCLKYRAMPPLPFLLLSQASFDLKQAFALLRLSFSILEWDLLIPLHLQVCGVQPCWWRFVVSFGGPGQQLEHANTSCITLHLIFLWEEHRGWKHQIEVALNNFSSPCLSLYLQAPLTCSARPVALSMHESCWW